MPYDAYGSAGAFGNAVTLYDVYRQIRREPELSVFESQRLINQIKDVTKKPSFTPVEEAMSSGLGGVAGFAVSKFFNMGPVGQALTTVLGIGVGKKLNDHFNKPPQMRGWKILEH